MTHKGERAVFLDRDGTINVDVVHCSRIEDFHVLPGVPEAIARLNRAGLKVVVVTNQSAVARGLITLEGLEALHDYMRSELARLGSARLDAIYYCPHGPWDGCDCRKPKPGMLLRAAQEMGLDLGASYMVGDADSDMQAGAAAGCKTVFLSPKGLLPGLAQPDHTARDLADAVQWVLKDAAQAAPHSG